MSESERLPVAPVGATEDNVIDESQWGAIHALRQRGRSKKAIARELGIDVKTVRKWLKQGWKPQTRRPRGGILDAWEEFLRGRAPEVGYNAMVLYRELQGQDYSGSYPTVQRYIRPLREEAQHSATVRFETAPGAQAQVDWGSTRVWFGEEAVRVHLFVMVLGYSRRVFAYAYGNERLDALLDGHERALEHFGGIPETILYDNPRTIVLDKDKASGAVRWNPVFKDRLDFYGIVGRLCRYYRAQTKGKVESGVKYVKRNSLAGRRFRDLEDLNAWLLEWCVSVADQRVHGTTHELPAVRFERSERSALQPLPSHSAPPRERVMTRLVPRDGYVAFDTNRYPVPLEWAGRQVEVQVLVDEVVIHAAGEESVRHGRLEGRHDVAPWRGPSRRVPSTPTSPEGPPQWDPAYVAASGTVETRALSTYEELCEVSP